MRTSTRGSLDRIGTQDFHAVMNNIGSDIRVVPARPAPAPPGARQLPAYRHDRFESRAANLAGAANHGHDHAAQWCMIQQFTNKALLPERHCSTIVQLIFKSTEWPEYLVDLIHIPRLIAKAFLTNDIYRTKASKGILYAIRRRQPARPARAQGFQIP